MKPYLKYLAGVCILVDAQGIGATGIGSALGAMAGRADGAGATHLVGAASQVDDLLARISEHMNRRMPQNIDADTRLDRVSSEPGPRFIYHYTLVNVKSDEIGINQFSSAVRSHLAQHLCDSSQVRTFFRHGITVAYIYRSVDGRALGGTAFAPDACDQGHASLEMSPTPPAAVR